MDIFTRRFAIEHLIDHRHDSGLAALFDRWVLPGEDAGPHGLRLAIRGGYLNFYVKGQSVGELRVLAGWPRLKIHRKYKEFAEKGSSRAAELGQKYEIVNSDRLMSIGPEVVDGWIRTAETYAGAEKRFVDDLVAVTPGVIDLEMALPADDDSVGKDRTAPRMDLVVAQGTDIAFWEAKCAINGELRAHPKYKETPDGDYVEGPHVLWQLRRYERWVNRPHRLHQVREAYRESARLLLELAELFDKKGEAVERWRRLASAGDTASVILPPGIIVSGYEPARAGGASGAKAATYGAKIDSFDKHRKRLLNHGATVKIVKVKPNAPILPDLQPGVISDVEQPI